MGPGGKIWLRLFLGVCFSGWVAAGGVAAAPDPVAAEDVRGPQVPVTAGPLVTETTIPQALGTLNIEAAGFLPLTGGRFGSNWNRMGAGGNFSSLATPVTWKYGLMPRSEVTAIVQYVHNWAQSVENPGPGGERSADFGGLGDTSLTYKYLLSEEKPAFPAMVGILTVNFPRATTGASTPGFWEPTSWGRGPTLLRRV